jgi:hypothetical protein
VPLQRIKDWSCLTLALYRMRPHNERRVSEAAKGADPIQPFEGSRPWKGNYANSIGRGVMGKASGRGGQNEGRIGLVEVCARWQQAESVCGEEGRRTPPAGARPRVREVGIVISCGGSGKRRRRTELQLGGSKSLDENHGATALGTEPKRAGWLNEGRCWFGLRRWFCAE